MVAGMIISQDIVRWVQTHNGSTQNVRNQWSQAGRWGPTRPEPTGSSRCTYQDLGSIQYTTQTLPLFWKTPRHEQAAFQCKEESQLCHKGQMVVASTTIPGILQLLVQPLLYMMKRIKIYQSTLNDASYLHKITPVSGQMFLQHIWQFEFVVNQQLLLIAKQLLTNAQYHPVIQVRTQANPSWPWWPLESHFWTCPKHMSPCNDDLSSSALPMKPIGKVKQMPGLILKPHEQLQ